MGELVAGVITGVVSFAILSDLYRAGQGGRAWFEIGLIPVLPGQPSPPIESSDRGLTVHKQSWNILSVAYGAIVRLDLKHMQRVCPVQSALSWWTAIVVENDQVGREVILVDDPARKPLWVVDTIILRSSQSDATSLGFGLDVGDSELGLGQNFKHGVRGVHKGLIEGRLV